MGSQKSQHSSPNGEVIRFEGINDIRNLCSHVFEGGRRCASPALRNMALCYHHQPERIGLPCRNDLRSAERHHGRNFPLPCPTNQVELQQALGIILQALAQNRIAVRRAGRLLAALQELSNYLPGTTYPASSSFAESPNQLQPRPARAGPNASDICLNR